MNVLVSSGLDVDAASIVSCGDATWGLARTAAGPKLAVLAPHGAALLAALDGDRTDHDGAALVVGPTSAANASILRQRLPWLAPAPLGLATSVGLGDRLGLATRGHIRAMHSSGSGIRPVFAQQSMREMGRTSRSPRQVIDDAMWAVFEAGWRDGYGADADHLKEPGDVDACLAAGFTLFTIDPGAHVDDSAEQMSPASLGNALGRLPWTLLEDSPGDVRRRYLGRRFACDGALVTFDEATLTRAAVKYGRAVAHVAGMYRHLKARASRPVEVEVSVDETNCPTSHAEHVWVATELSRLEVQWVGLAPRFVGRFEKGVDYIGDLAGFEAHFAGHAAIARALGPYKISLHSGSDKFSIYPAAAAHSRGLVHLKTAGTSYLEALRTAARADPSLFRRIYSLARDRYETDRASYHVSARLDRAPTPGSVADADLAALLDDFDAREILHVTFGSVLTVADETGASGLGDALLALLARHSDDYATNLERHFARHLAPFASEQRWTSR